MYIKGVNDKDLCKLIYKAGALLFPQYKDLFNDDLEDFQQQCAVLILPKLRNYNSEKGALSTYIYKSLPLVISYWATSSKESKTRMFNNNRVPNDLLMNHEKNEDSDYLYVDDTDIRRNINIKEELLKYKEYPIVVYKDIYEYTFVDIGKMMNMNIQQVIYRYKKEINKIKCKKFHNF